MYCTNCGKKIPDGSRFCPECGAELNVSSSLPSFQTPKVNETNQKPIGTTGSSIMKYSRWILLASAALVLIAGFLPVLSISSFIGDSEHYSIMYFARNSVTEVVIMFTLAEIFAGLTLLSEILRSMEQIAPVTGIITFGLTLVYFVVLYQTVTKDYIFASSSVGAGPIMMLIFSIVLLIFGILDLVQRKKA